jgi:hypothetical protein
LLYDYDYDYGYYFNTLPKPTHITKKSKTTHTNDNIYPTIRIANIILNFYFTETHLPSAYKRKATCNLHPTAIYETTKKKLKLAPQRLPCTPTPDEDGEDSLQPPRNSPSLSQLNPTKTKPPNQPNNNHNKMSLSPSQASPGRLLQRSYNSMAIGDLLNSNSEERPQKYQRVGGREDGYRVESNMGYAMGPPGEGGVNGHGGHGGNLGHPGHLGMGHVNNGGHDRMNGHMMNGHGPNGGHLQPGHDRNNNHGIITNGVVGHMTNGVHSHGHPGHERNESHSSHSSSGSNISNLTETNRIQLLLNTPEPERSSQQGQQQSQISIHVQSQQLHTQHSQASQATQATHGSQASHGSQTQQAQQRANTPGAISVTSTAGSPPNSQYLTVDKRSFMAARVVCDTCGEGFTCDSLLR